MVLIKKKANPAFLCLVNAGGYSLGGCGGAGSCALVPNPFKTKAPRHFLRNCVQHTFKNIFASSIDLKISLLGEGTPLKMR